MIVAALALCVLSVAAWPRRPAAASRRVGTAVAGRTAPEVRPARSARRILPRSRADPSRTGADAADLLALGLDSGLPIGDAMEVADVGRDEIPDLVARALVLSERTGAPVAQSARLAARAVRTAQEGRARRRTAIAAARASMTVLTVLPLVGPLVIPLLGMDPAEVYGTRLGLACLGVGVGLTGGGWWVSTLLVRRAARPSTVNRPAHPCAINDAR